MHIALCLAISTPSEKLESRFISAKTFADRFLIILERGSMRIFLICYDKEENKMMFYLYF